MDSTTICQWCDSVDTYVSGHSPMSTELQHRCRECHGFTYADEGEWVAVFVEISAGFVS